jgi:hypothetical protein
LGELANLSGVLFRLITPRGLYFLFALDGLAFGDAATLCCTELLATGVVVADPLLLLLLLLMIAGLCGSWPGGGKLLAGLLMTGLAVLTASVLTGLALCVEKDVDVDKVDGFMVGVMVRVEPPGWVYESTGGADGCGIMGELEDEAGL